MTQKLKATATAMAVLVSAAGGVTLIAGPASAKPGWTENCTALNKVYPHGVGKAGAHDKTSGTPVTNFKRSTKIYNEAMSYNKGLDRDHDGIACEKA